MKLYQHQIDALEETKDFNRVAFFHDMGLGKTYTGAEKMQRLGGRVNLVICQKSKIRDWFDHFVTNYPEMSVADLTVSGIINEYINEHNNVIVGVINYDLIFRRPELMCIEYDTILLDESSMIQNDRAKRTRAIMKLKTQNVILLSGTPTGGKYENLYSQLNLLGWKITKTEYYRQFINTTLLDIGGAKIPIVTGYKNIARLKRKMREYGCHFLQTKDVFDLPQQSFIDVYVDSSSKYRQFCKTSIVTVGDRELVGDTTLTEMLYQRQLCGAYSAEKLKALSDILESTDDRLIIFYNFNEELRQIRELIKRPLSIVNGSKKDLTAYEEKSNSITLIQYQAGARGLNLQKANKIVYFSPPLSSELYEQSKKRIHRINQIRPCFYYQLICKNSIEEKIYEVLNERKDYTDRLFKMG